LSSSTKKQRLDILLTEYRPDFSRSRVQAEIMAGRVMVDGRVIDKPGTTIAAGAVISLLEPENPYVSRGGLKIDGALEALSIDVNGLKVLDVGASTGGFSDCLLSKGAALVYALDVGYGQLAQSLRNDHRVVVMERYNVRHLQEKDLPVKPDLATVDVSFISLTKVLPVLANLQIPAVLALVKPQFEAGRADADRGGGVIRDPAVHRRVLRNMIEFACQSGYCCHGITYSQWPGPKGNVEYFIYLMYREESACNCMPEHASKLEEVVVRAHNTLF